MPELTIRAPPEGTPMQGDQRRFSAGTSTWYACRIEGMACASEDGVTRLEREEGLRDVGLAEWNASLCSEDLDELFVSGDREVRLTPASSSGLVVGWKQYLTVSVAQRLSHFEHPSDVSTPTML